VGVRPEGLTLRQLWTMAQGRLVAQRQMLIAQAAVLFFDGRPEALEHFLLTGSLDSGKQNVIPCSLAMFEAMQRQKDQRHAVKPKRKR